MGSLLILPFRIFNGTSPSLLYYRRLCSFHDTQSCETFSIHRPIAQEFCFGSVGIRFRAKTFSVAQKKNIIKKVEKRKPPKN